MNPKVFSRMWINRWEIGLEGKKGRGSSGKLNVVKKNRKKICLNVTITFKFMSQMGISMFSVAPYLKMILCFKSLGNN
jgi:hypothetical protein